MAKAARARRAIRAKGSQVHPARYIGVLRRAGINYKITKHGITILGRGRAPKPIFPKARYKWLRGITY